MDIKSKAPVRFFLLLILPVFLLASCNGSSDYSPKPRGYYRINFPKRAYRQYTGAGPFTFMYPTYAFIEQDTHAQTKYTKLMNMKYLINMQFPQFNGTLHLSYESIASKKVFDMLIEDAHSFAFKHTVKATSIDEGIIRYPDRKVYGIYYTIDGNAASSAQFYLTDSVKNYMRGALYFNSQPQLDSIQPVLNFVKQDMNVMIKTFKWK